MTFAIYTGHWAAYLLAIVVIGTRQHAMAILMHDASHYRLLRNRTANDVVSDFFLAFPVGVSTSLYRRRHLQHHRHTNTDLDPDWSEMQQDEDWRWPKSRTQLVRLLVLDLLGLNAPKTLKIISNWSPYPRLFSGRRGEDGLGVREKLTLVSLLAITATGLTLSGLWLEFLVLWIVPSLTVLTAIFRIRSVAEHLVTPNTHELNASRTVEPTWIEKLLVAPCAVNYHLEHHLFPSVPFYNLAKLHKVLVGDPAFSRAAHISRGYLSFEGGVLGEVTR
jgi:fatty acid desaturase